MKHHLRSILCLFLLAVATLVSACAQTPEKVRAWENDSRAPAKMREFILDHRNSLPTKIESALILVERNQGNELPEVFAGPVSTAELNQIVQGLIPRMNGLIEKDEGYETRVKDAAYYLLSLDLNDDNRDALMEIIRKWLDSENFFLSMEKAGRIEQAKLFELLGTDSLVIYQHAIESKLDALDKALEKENKTIEERRAKGESPKIRYRPSDTIASTITSTLASLDELKIPTANDVVAEMFVNRMEKYYPNMPRVYAIPFSSNTSDKLRPMAKKILSDQEYKNTNLNYFKDVMLATYYKKVQKADGIELCTELIKTDKTGYTRWDCMELLTQSKGREGLASLIKSLPDDYAVLGIPADHPTFLETPSMTFWNSMRVYCTHLPQLLSNQVPLEVFRQYIENGSKVDRILSIACLSTLGVESDIEIFNKLKSDKTNMAEYEMKVTTLGELANYALEAVLKRRVAAMQPKAEEKPAGEAQK